MIKLRRRPAPTTSRSWLRRRILIAGSGAVALAAVAALALTPSGAEAASLFGTTRPAAVSADPDTQAVELGVRFSTSSSGVVTGIRFYKSPDDTGDHVGSLWSADGRKLASAAFEDESATGWQTAELDTPVRLRAGNTYVASYLSPRGHYSAADNFYTSDYRQGALTVPAGGGVYSYTPGNFPNERWQNSNYFVDVNFTAFGGTAPQNPAETTAPSASFSPTATPTTATSSTPSPTPTVPTPTTASPTPTAPTTSNPTSNTSPLTLARIPWEGGSAYWKQFSVADKAGWSDPSFFPIIAWFNGVSNNAEVQYDKSLGINTYIGMWEGTPYKLFEDNGVFWAGAKLNDTFTANSKNWVGAFLDDEVDGRFTPSEGRAHLQALRKQYDGTGRFTYANYTQIVMSKDSKPADAEAYVNDMSDVVSLDMYYYTIPYCNRTPYRDVYVTPINQKYCRTASSYGRSIDSLRARDATDGKLKPLWQWVENLNGGPGEGPFTAYITPSQLQGAVMNSIIHEARGIAYFNQSFTGSCTGGSIFRQSQVTPNFCGAAQVNAAKEVNSRIRQLAPIINTQSYKYTFGPNMDTMLKADDGSIYVFAMVDGNSDPGSRTFTLPAEVKGRSVEVLFENRTLTADSSGKFSDSFAQESTYHVYKIAR